MVARSLERAPPGGHERRRGRERSRRARRDAGRPWSHGDGTAPASDGEKAGLPCGLPRRWRGRTQTERRQQRPIGQRAACRRAFLGGSVVRQRRSGAATRWRKSPAPWHLSKCASFHEMQNSGGRRWRRIRAASVASGRGLERRCPCSLASSQPAGGGTAVAMAGRRSSGSSAAAESSSWTGAALWRGIIAMDDDPALSGAAPPRISPLPRPPGLSLRRQPLAR